MLYVVYGNKSSVAVQSIFDSNLRLGAVNKKSYITHVDAYHSIAILITINFITRFAFHK